MPGRGGPPAWYCQDQSGKTVQVQVQMQIYYYGRTGRPSDFRARQLADEPRPSWSLEHRARPPCASSDSAALAVRLRILCSTVDVDAEKRIAPATTPVLCAAGTLRACRCVPGPPCTRAWIPQTARNRGLARQSVSVGSGRSIEDESGEASDCWNKTPCSFSRSRWALPAQPTSPRPLPRSSTALHQTVSARTHTVRVPS